METPTDDTASRPPGPVSEHPRDDMASLGDAGLFDCATGAPGAEIGGEVRENRRAGRFRDGMGPQISFGPYAPENGLGGHGDPDGTHGCQAAHGDGQGHGGGAVSAHRAAGTPEAGDGAVPTGGVIEGLPSPGSLTPRPARRVRALARVLGRAAGLVTCNPMRARGLVVTIPARVGLEGL